MPVRPLGEVVQQSKNKEEKVKGKNSGKKKMLLAASVAGLVAVAGMVLPASTVYAADLACSGVNACAGKGDCGGKGNSCAGKNACKGEGWVNVPTEELCTKIGGTIIPAAH